MVVKISKNEKVASSGVAESSKLINKKKKKIVVAAESSDMDPTEATKLPKKKKQLSTPAAVEGAEETKLPLLERKHKKKDAKKLANVEERTAEDATLATGLKLKKKAKQPKGKNNVMQKKIKAIPDDKEVETSESDTEGEDDESKVVENQESPKRIARGKEYTLFVGNLPPTIKTGTVKGIFKKYGTILTVRVRTHDGQKVLYRKEKTKAKSLNFYVRFAEEEQMKKACEMDGQTVEEHRIRVCPQDVKPMGAVNSTVFVGNIHKGTTDNELYEFFGRVGEIEYVRQIANKYIAYVCFKKGVSIKKALKLNLEKLNNRPLRITKVDPTITNLRKNKKGHLVKKNRLPNATKAATPDASKANEKVNEKVNDFHGNVVNEGEKKKNRSKKRSLQGKKILSQKLMAAMNTTNKD